MFLSWTELVASFFGVDSRRAQLLIKLRRKGRGGGGGAEEEENSSEALRKIVERETLVFVFKVTFLYCLYNYVVFPLKKEIM